MADLKSCVLLVPSYANDFDQQLFVSLKALGTAYYNPTYGSDQLVVSKAI